MTIPAGSTNVPVTSTSGFTVGQQLSIGYGGKTDVATVTAVGTPGSQDYLAAAATAGSDNLKVTSTDDISVGDKIRLDIGSNAETVTVASVGTAGASGTGLTLAAPLKFSHAFNLPFSDRGTGVTFSPATRFPHSSNEPVQPLDTSITLNEPLHTSFATNTAVIDSAVTTAGFQGSTAPNRWLGGPDLSSSAGSMVLRDASGDVADSLNYGAIVDPAAAEGYQGVSGSAAGGCYAPSPPTGGSDIRYPDGNNTDSNCNDFVTSSNPTPGAANQP
jgi:non-reducing end alpha-L-arabinofuranosidase